MAAIRRCTQRYIDSDQVIESKRLAGAIQLQRGRKGRRATEDDIHGPVGDLGHRLAAEWVWERAACGDGYTAATRLVRCVCREPSRSGLLGGLSARVSLSTKLSIYLTSEPVCRCAPMMSELYLR